MRLADALEKQTISVIGATNRSVKPEIVVVDRGKPGEPLYSAIEDDHTSMWKKQLFWSGDLLEVESVLSENAPLLNPDAWELQ